jgi:hypothetical protein
MFHHKIVSRRTYVRFPFTQHRCKANEKSGEVKKLAYCTEGKLTSTHIKCGNFKLHVPAMKNLCLPHAMKMQRSVVAKLHAFLTSAIVLAIGPKVRVFEPSGERWISKGDNNP